MGKLASIGVPDNFLDFLNEYLNPRIGYAMVEGAFSDAFELANQVFQGTVLGPPLWNTFFGDVAIEAATGGGTPRKFADDLNVFQKFPMSTTNADIMVQMAKTRVNVHRWGKRNRVLFDAGKEHIAIVHPVHGEGDDFKILGTIWDAQLNMQTAVETILKKARPKVSALLRTRGLYDHANMLGQYKTHIWSYIEHHNGVIMHAAPSAVKRLDDMQGNFLKELHLLPESAFLDYNFAPSCLRRDIGILGFLHKRVLGECHAALMDFLPRRPTCAPWHDKQLDSRTSEFLHRRSLYNKSLFNKIGIYNRLPQEVVDINNVSGFQRCLTDMARRKCAARACGWQHIFHTSLAY